jgi:4'-phosphopantetheinyl transferase
MEKKSGDRDGVFPVPSPHPALFSPAMTREHLDHYIVARLMRLSENEGSLADLESRLSEQDRERAVRYRFADDKARFILGRGLLAKLLRHYLGQEALDLEYTAQGRPFLPHAPAVQFSISHSRDLVAVALANETLVGVDVECVTREFHMDEIAERIFSDEDLRKFQGLSTEEARPAFFHAWTGKEAYLKARGIGISGGLKEVPVPFGSPDSEGMILHLPEGEASQAWCLRPLPVPADYMAHIAWNNPHKTMDFREKTIRDEP